MLSSQDELNMVTLLVVALILDELSLLRGASQVVTALEAIGATVSHYAVERLGWLVLLVDLSTAMHSTRSLGCVSSSSSQG